MFFNRLLSEQLKIFSGLKPSSDRFSSVNTVNWFSMSLYDKALGILDIGIGATGTAVVTVLAASDSSGTGAEAIAFSRRRIGAASDTAGTLTATASTGFTTTAGGGDMYLLEIDATDLPDGKHYVQFCLTEGVDSPVAAALIVILGAARYAGATLPAAMAASGLGSSSPSASVSSSPSPSESPSSSPSSSVSSSVSSSPSSSVSSSSSTSPSPSESPSASESSSPSASSSA